MFRDLFGPSIQINRGRGCTKRERQTKSRLLRYASIRNHCQVTRAYQAAAGRCRALPELLRATIVGFIVSAPLEALLAPRRRLSPLSVPPCLREPSVELCRRLCNRTGDHVRISSRFTVPTNEGVLANGKSLGTGKVHRRRSGKMKTDGTYRVLLILLFALLPSRLVL